MIGSGRPARAATGESPLLSNAGSRADATAMNELQNTPRPLDDSAAPIAAAQERRRADRRDVLDRRAGADRRDETVDASVYDRRRGPGRRRTDYRRDAEEGHMNEEQLEFIKAIDEYKRVNSRPFPTWTEILDLFLYLGYRKVAPVGAFKLCKGRQTPPRLVRPEAEEPDDEPLADTCD